MLAALLCVMIGCGDDGGGSNETYSTGQVHLTTATAANTTSTAAA